jgi:predicted transporter
MEALSNIGITWSLWFTAFWWIAIVVSNWNTRKIDAVKLAFFVVLVPAPIILIDFLLGK